MTFIAADLDVMNLPRLIATMHNDYVIGARPLTTCLARH
jgi:hypothetical protein